jgi:PAS domain-containing protein
MNGSPLNPQADHYLSQLLTAVADYPAKSTEALDAIPVPVYMTDITGAVTYWNAACVQFAGRQPELGRDRWCVTWRLYTMTGEPLPHEVCPMALAIRRREPRRGDVAIALRPDGSRRAFNPYPVPLFGEDGELTGAVNMLIDVTEEQAETLASQSARCRRLAAAIDDRQASSVLKAMAEGYDTTARELSKA